MIKAARIPLKAIAGIILIILAVFAAIQSPKVQTFVGEKIVQKLQNSLDADLTFKMVALRPFEAITLDDVVIIDRNPKASGADTIACVGSLSAKFSVLGLLTGNGVYLRNVKLSNSSVCLVIEPDSVDIHGRLNLLRVLKLPYKEKDDTPPSWGNILHARDLSVHNVHFRLINMVGPRTVGSKIDFNNLDVTLHRLEARNIKLADSKILATVRTLQATENPSGYNIRNLSAKRLRISTGRLRLERLHLLDDFSDLDLRLLQMDGRLKEYSDFVDKVRITGEIEPGSLFSMKSVSFFGPNLDHMGFRAQISTKVEGYVNDFLVKDLVAKDIDHNFSLKTNGRVLNVTDIQNSAMDIKLREAFFTLRGLEGFIADWAPDVRMGFEKLAKGKIFNFSGAAKGPLNRLGVKGTLVSDIGSANADITLRNTVDLHRPIIIDGCISTKNLDAGKIAGIDAIGPITLATGLSATLPKGGSPKVQIDSLKIDRLHALGYDYSNISAAGNYAEDAFDGRITAADPNLNFLFQGKFNLSNRTQNQVYRFYASLGYADLHALNIDKRPTSKISFNAYSNFLFTESHDLLGDVNISDLNLVNDSGSHNLGNISVRSHANDNVHRIKLESGFLDGSYVGDRDISKFVSDIKNLALDRELGALFVDRSPKWDGASYKLNIKAKGTLDLLDFLARGVYVANPTELSINVDTTGIVKGRVKSGRIALGEKYIKDVDLDLSNERDVLVAHLESSSIQIARGVKLLGSRLSLFANDNRVGLGYSFDNSEQDATKAELILGADLSRDEDGLAVVGRAMPSNLYYKGSGWAISSGDIKYKGGSISIDKLNARHEDELLEVDGGFSTTMADTLKVTMEKFAIGIINTFTGNLFGLSGRASGNAVVISPGSPFPGIEAGIVCDSTIVSGQRMGTLNLSSYWDHDNKRFNMSVFNKIDGRRAIDLSGYLVPEDWSIHADARVDKLNIAVASPILSTVFSTIDGDISGDITASGPLSNVQLSSKDLRVSDGHLALDFTRALYSFEGDLALDQEALHFNKLHLADGAGGTGVVNGELLLNGFKNLGLAIHLDINRLKAIDLKKGENPTLYGSLPVSGTVDVKGPLNRIVVDVNAVTSGNGNLHLPIGSSAGERQRNMLVFTEPVDDLQQDPYELMMASNSSNKAADGNLIINLVTRATPDANVFIDLGENTLNARGDGTIGLKIETAQNSFGLSGDYTLKEGSFRFSAMNIVSRDFTIQDGSSVRFNGPIDQTDLNVRGLYVTKASIAPLVASTLNDGEGGGTTRRTVNCEIKITGKLSNPELDFAIDVPDLNPSTKMEIENAFNTKDKVQKQFLYLLIAGSFLPPEESGITNTGSDVLFSNVSSIMSGQINNIFSKLNIPLDLGLNYTNNQGQNMFDVALSTQLFNNRVIVNGAVGNKQKIGSTSSEIAGDIEVEIKLNKSGSLRTTVFSHSADQFSTYLDNSQRNGIGITLQKDFYTFRQFFKDLFTPKKKKEEQTGRAMPQTLIQIDSTGKAKVISNEQR